MRENFKRGNLEYGAKTQFGMLDTVTPAPRSKNRIFRDFSRFFVKMMKIEDFGARARQCGFGPMLDALGDVSRISGLKK